MNTNSKNCKINGYLNFFHSYLNNKEIHEEFYLNNVSLCNATNFNKEFYRNKS